MYYNETMTYYNGSSSSPTTLKLNDPWILQFINIKYYKKTVINTRHILFTNIVALLI